MQTSRHAEPLLWWERWCLWMWLPLIVAFGVLVEVRSAYLSRRMGDLGCFLRAAWAVRQGGQDLYNIRSDTLWSYNYPPLLAIVLVPLADPPAGQLGGGLLSYEASVAVWYLFSALCLFWGLHALAAALEASEPGSGPAPGSRRWWALRYWPMLACLPAIGSTLMKGQVNLIVLALVCGFLAALVRGRSLRAGLFLAIAICLKIFPGFLVLLPLWRRNVRCLMGCALGLLIGLVLVPVVAMGPKQTVGCYQDFTRVLLAPGLGLGGDKSRAKELTGVSGTDNHALVAMMHHTIHRDRATRPTQVAPIVSRLHWVLGGAMTLLTLAAFRRRHFLPGQEGAREVLFCGSLIMVMLLVCPVTHLHYFCMPVPLLMALMVLKRGDSPYPQGWLLALMGLQLGSIVLEQLPGLEALRDLRLAGYAAVVLWAAACWMGRRAEAAPVLPAVPAARAA